MGARHEARAALAAAGLRPQRRWGQHFLCDPAVARRIVDLADVGPASAVLEIGPGLGALTDLLAARAGSLTLVEVDPDLAARLRERHAADARVRVLVGDVLEVPLGDLVPERDVTVVANLPYNVAVAIVFRLQALAEQFPRAVVMVQREVAERFVAPAGSAGRGITSVLLQTFADVRLAFGVSRRSFLPPPRVESAVLDIRWRARPRVDVGSPPVYRDLVRAAFGQRRKMLRNALAAFAAAHGLEREGLGAFLQAVDIDPAARAETLELEDFGRLARAFGSPLPRAGTA